MKIALLTKQILTLVAFAMATTGLNVFAATETPAAEAPQSVTPTAAGAKGDKKTTDVSFEDVLVQGKYHFSDEAVTTVEEDKVLDSLLGIRKDFQDRIKKSVSRQ